MIKRLGCLGGIFAALIVVAAISYQILTKGLAYLKTCIAPLNHDFIVDHPWDTNSVGCWDTRLTMLTRYLSAKPWVPTRDNNFDRFFAQGILSESECHGIVGLAASVGGGFQHGGRTDEGDGFFYYGPSSEFRHHGIMEIFRQSVTEHREQALQLAGAVRRMQDEVRRYFANPCIWPHTVDITMREARPVGNLSKRLSLQDRWELRLTRGHPMHSDSCAHQPWTLECHAAPRESDNWRNISSVLYLNLPHETFAGGEFYMVDHDRYSLWLGPAFHFLFSYLYVTPRCGTMVSYRNMNNPLRSDSHARKNIHGTFAVEEGRRFSLAVWWTHSFKRRSTEIDSSMNTLLGPSASEDPQCSRK